MRKTWKNRIESHLERSSGIRIVAGCDVIEFNVSRFRKSERIKKWRMIGENNCNANKIGGSGLSEDSAQNIL